MNRAVIATNPLGDGDDPKSGNRSANENRGVMNDQQKSAPPKQQHEPASRKEGVPPAREGRWNEKVPVGGPRSREPYVTWLGECLRQSYEETLNEPVPEQFHDLLERLERQDEDKSST